MIEPLSLPADLVVLQEVGLVRPDARLRGAVDAARTKALGKRGVEHFIGIELVCEVQPRNVAAAGHPIIEVRARGVWGRGGGKALLLTRSEGEIQRISVEALQSIVVGIV